MSVTTKQGRNYITFYDSTSGVTKLVEIQVDKSLTRLPKGRECVKEMGESCFKTFSALILVLIQLSFLTFILFLSLLWNLKD